MTMLQYRDGAILLLVYVAVAASFRNTHGFQVISVPSSIPQRDSSPITFASFPLVGLSGNNNKPLRYQRQRRRPRWLASVSTSEKEGHDNPVRNNEDSDSAIAEPISVEEEYHRRLKEAQAAFAAVEEARKKLALATTSITNGGTATGEEAQKNDKKTLLSMTQGEESSTFATTFESADEIGRLSNEAPISRALISYTDADTLEITLPPQNMGMSTLMSGAFSLAWFSAITPATFAARGAASMLFMLPFWVAGGAVAKAGVVDPLVRQKFTLGQYAWSLTKELAGQTIQKVEKPTERLKGVSVRLVDIVNDIPRYELELLMSGSGDNYSFGIWTGEEKKKEAEELLKVINTQLKKFQTSR